MTLFDRPMQWVQHITFGPPFLELNKTYADASVAKAVVREKQEYATASWPEMKDPTGKMVDLRVFSGSTGTWLLDRSRPKVYFTIYNSDYPVLLGYIFPSAQNPWILDWQENQRAKQIPWNGKVIARAICIGESPAQGLRAAIERGNVLGVPIYSWIQARQRRTETYVFFLAEIPLGFKGVSDVRTEDGRIVIVERETGKTITLKSARPF